MIRNFSLIIGVVAGLLYTAGLFVSYSMGVPSLGDFLTWYTWLPVVFLLVLGGAWWLRTQSAEAPDFKPMLQYALLAYLIYELIYGGVTYYLFAVKDRGLNDRLVEHLLKNSTEKMLEKGAGKDQIEAATEMADSHRAPLTFMQLLIGFGQNMILHFIKSIIIATITKQTITKKS
ncbi:DUF4199 domain-containing protein [Flavihumibacter stibioxidans]|uniref:DUF4199 domain-containing protein n=1 Tax=Flavihumibacter stibioxidans TaxID=1834163 RepID=A0ABR7M388_9BACT|nr:DUF4199 domain-containing protein [Flavihumibacter stibioxidans]MBC6489437.1 hypothetical protein [Flavihumibacter stibioxidans]